MQGVSKVKLIQNKELTEVFTDFNKEYKKRTLIVEQIIQIEHIKKYFYSIIEEKKLNIILALEKLISCRSVRDLAKKMGIKNTNTRKMYNLRKHLISLRDSGIIYFEDYVVGSKENNYDVKNGKRVFIKNIRLTEWARGILPFTKLIAAL